MTDREKLIDIRNQIDEFLSGELTVSLTRKSDHIHVEWTGEIDNILFQIDEGKVHDVEQMRDDGLNPPPIQGNSYKLGRTDNIDKKWRVSVVQGEATESDTVEAAEQPTPPPEKIVGMWDSISVYEDLNVNVQKGYVSQLDQLAERGDDLIPILDFFEYDFDEARIREEFENVKDRIEEHSAQISLIILQDEPYYAEPDAEPFTKEKLEQIVEIGKEVLGDYKFCYTFADDNLPRFDLPKNVDVAGVNLYLFFEGFNNRRYIDNEQDFLEEAHSYLDLIPASTKILIVGQTFSHPGKYRKPPAESPLWHLPLIEKPNVSGILWYKYKYEKGKGLNLMTEVKDDIKTTNYEITLL